MEKTISKKRFQCRDCIYSYNPEIGDPTQGIEPGTAFEDLPSTWQCPVCRVGKRRFRPISN